MRLTTIVAASLIGSLSYAQNCAPLDYYWSNAPFEIYADASRVDPGLESRVLLESEKIPGVIREILNRHTPRATMVLSYDPPSQISWFSSLNPDQVTTAGTRVEDSAAFVATRLMAGYYNPARVARGSSSVNVILHEYGHLVYEALRIEGSDLHGEFREASESFRPWARRHYERNGRSDEEYELMIDHETFAESFAHMYHRGSTRHFFERDHPDLYAFMTSLESYAVEVLNVAYAFGYEQRCETARLINPDAWRPQTILNLPEFPE